MKIVCLKIKCLDGVTRYLSTGGDCIMKPEKQSEFRFQLTEDVNMRVNFSCKESMISAEVNESPVLSEAEKQFLQSGLVQQEVLFEL